MRLPNSIPSLKIAAILYAIYAVIWANQEGSLTNAVIMGAASATLLTLYLGQRLLGGRLVSLRGWLLAMAMLGLFFGLGSNLLTLGFMALKTGLHAHGPEFSRAEIEWVLRQGFLWPPAGLLAGLGLGLLRWRA